MSYNFVFPTTSGNAAQAVIPPGGPIAGATLTVEFASSADFGTISLTKSVTSDAHGQIVVPLTSAEVDLVKDGVFRVKAVVGGNTTVVSTGRCHYTPPTQTAADLTSLKALFGASTVGNRMRRAATEAVRDNSLTLGVMSSPPTITTSGGANPDGALSRAYTVSNNPGAFRFTGGTPTPAFGGAWYAMPVVSMPSGSGGNAAGVPESNAYGFAVEFVSDAPRLLIWMVNTNITKQLEVDGQIVSASSFAMPGGGGDGWILIDFSGVSKVRRFRLEASTGDAFGGVYVAPTRTVWAPTSATNVRVVSIGDSVCSNTGAIMPNGGWQTVAGKLLGWTDVRQIAFGGTGFSNAGSYNTFGDPKRVTDAVNARPDLLMIHASGNDNAQSGVQTAALSTFRAYRAALPTVPIVVTGVDTFAGSAANIAVQQATEGAVKAAFTQWADPLSYFIPVWTDPTGSWHTGTGYVGATAGDGNADIYSVDGAHPNDAGHAYLGRRLANALRSLVLPQVP